MNNLIEEFKKQTGGTIESLKREIGGIRSNRPSTALVDEIKVNYYDQMLPLKQVGAVSIEPPRQILIQVWDQSAVAGVSKAIETSGLGLSANVDGNVIRVFLPELSEERRQEFIKHVKKIVEQHRIQVRHSRDEVNKKIQKALDDKEIDEDAKFKLKEAIQKQTDEANELIEKILEMKIKEINE
ncbi:MAG: ribosome recycling factor [Patescibacteria group bacterium]